MQSRTLIALTFFLPALAHADPAKQAATDLGPFYQLWPTMRDDPGSRAGSEGHDPKIADCDAAIANARKAGLKDDARLYVKYYISGLDETSFDERREPYVTLASAAAMCAAYRKRLLIMPAAAAQTKTAQTIRTYKALVDSGDTGSLGGDMGTALNKTARECRDVTDRAIKAGAPTDVKVSIAGEVMTIAHGRTTICEPAIEWTSKLGGKIAEAHEAAFEAAAAPWRALGVGGKRLELFVEYDDVGWRGGRGCQVISDRKRVAKAKALFHWLERPDGTHEIRKYTFKGNKVSGPVVRYYDTAAKAQAGCR